MARYLIEKAPIGQSMNAGDTFADYQRRTKSERKALQLNFFRPGDAINQTDDQIRFGVPAYQDEREQDYVLQHYGLTERLDYQWIFK